MPSKKRGFEKKNVDGTKKPNPKYVDALTEDKPISGQTWVCMSFISPEKILKQKDIFFFEEFLKKYELTKSMEKFVQFIHFAAFKYNISNEDLTKDFKDFVAEEKDTLTKTNMADEYKTFMDNHEEELQKKFDVQHEFQTNVRGVKVRGSYSSEEEARLRCKMLREVDPYHDIVIGPVGVWMPMDPEAYKTGDVEYLEEELNQLMHEKKKNESKAKQEFEYRVKESKEAAIQENIQKAEQSGNVLTQTLDENGQLVGVHGANTQETALKEKNIITTEAICNELFEGDNIVTGKTDNGKSLLQSGPFA